MVWRRGVRRSFPKDARWRDVDPGDVPVERPHFNCRDPRNHRRCPNGYKKSVRPRVSFIVDVRTTHMRQAGEG